MILEDRADMLILQLKEGDVITVPKTSYHTLKYGDFEENRIFYDFGDDLKVEETYNHGIFNCIYGKKRIQISDAEGIANSILNKDPGKYKAIFAEWYGVQQQKQVIEELLRSYAHRIVINGSKYEIDEKFAVDEHGAAFYKNGNDWHNLCLVAPNVQNSSTVEFPNETVMINRVTQTILAKVMFCLHPTQDKVFMNQLPENLRKYVRGIK